jgi:hypothetical protein
MRGRWVAAIGVLALLGGGAGGWLVRERHDWDQVQLIASAALARDLLTSRVHTVETTKRNSDGSETTVDHDADLRCLMHDPDALAVPATVRGVSRSDGMDDGDMVVELEVDTARGSFRTDWRGAVVPASGRRCEVFGRLADAGQVAGKPPLLDPGWLEPVGTMAKLDKKRDAPR